MEDTNDMKEEFEDEILTLWDSLEKLWTVLSVFILKIFFLC